MASRVTSPVIVGRRQELLALEAGLERAAAGEGGTFLVGGDAGIGKTRLLAEFTAGAGAAGATVLRGTCVSLGVDEGLPFAPIAEALRNLGRVLEPAVLAEVMDVATSELASLVPELAVVTERVSLGGRPDWAQTRVFEGLFTLLARLGTRTPVVLVVEDLHWADRSTRDVVAFLSRNLRTERVVIIGTFRTDELDRRHPLRPWLAEMDRSSHVTRLDLEPLDPAATRELIEAIIGTLPDEHLVRSIVRRAGGNPFFAEELLAAGADRDGDSLPEALRDVLLVRVDALSESAQAVLGCAAAAGTTFDHELLGSSCGLDQDTLAATLREAVAAQLVNADERSGAYSFRHALLQEAVYDDLLPEERHRYHARFAAALQARPVPDGALKASHFASLAHHASAAHDLPLALHGWIEAARANGRVSALAESSYAYERALDLWDAVDPEDRPPDLDLVDVLYDASLAMIGAGQIRRAREAAVLALAKLPTDADPLRSAIIRERYARTLWLDGDLTSALGVLEEAVALIADQPTTIESVRVVASLAGLLVLRDQNARAIEVGEQALSLARGIGARDAEAYALGGLGVAHVNRGDGETGLVMLREGLRLAHEFGLSAIETHRLYANLSSCLESAGQVEEAVAVALEGVEWAKQRGLWRMEGSFLESNAASSLLELGRWNEARALLDDRGGTAEGVARLNRAVVAGPLAVRTGRLESAHEILAPAFERVKHLEDAQFSGPIHAALLELAIAEGRFDDAIRLGSAGLDRMDGAEEVGNRYRLEILALVLRALGLALAEARGRRDTSRESALLAEADRSIDSVRAWAAQPTGPVAGYGAEAAAFAAMAEAEHRGIVGRPDPAAWAVAAERWAALRRPWPFAGCRVREAEAMLATRGSRAEAANALVEARSIAHRLGAAPMVEWCDTLARLARLDLSQATIVDPATTGGHAAAGPTGEPGRGGGRAGESARPGDREPPAFGLTTRELDVLRLLVAGYSNRQIGEALFISESTAGVHVSNILGKLGVSGRVEAAAVAVRVGLAD